MRIGVISDTHGPLRPEAIAALKGSDLIVHAGDVGRREVIEQLQDLAPTYAVRGNIDVQPWARKLPETETVNAGHQLLFVLHDISQLAVDSGDGGERVFAAAAGWVYPDRARLGVASCFSSATLAGSPRGSAANGIPPSTHFTSQREDGANRRC